MVLLCDDLFERQLSYDWGVDMHRLSNTVGKAYIIEELDVTIGFSVKGSQGQLEIWDPIWSAFALLISLLSDLFKLELQCEHLVAGDGCGTIPRNVLVWIFCQNTCEGISATV